ncbi:MAG: hypothetical protein RM049_38310 [Nostoc sp. DedQUE04]|uniref:hypothetical protein n=1 Tax=Nostoc sp. DedQUE04 TaxID=3075390 RepID=UPI002AD30FE2|nr:hypothetical protein [Nostoc sp. DedQUE04]MDZ8141075.1 hypothetical protein [Nostoc sp. DedQUE04]
MLPFQTRVLCILYYINYATGTVRSLASSTEVFNYPECSLIGFTRISNNNQ